MHLYREINCFGGHRRALSVPTSSGPSDGRATLHLGPILYNCTPYRRFTIQPLNSCYRHPKGRLTIRPTPREWHLVMSDVFLSYAREDLALAQKLASLLEANGLDVWWDRRLIAGDAINTTIEQAIDGAKAVIVLWSPNSIASRWVNGEAETAAESQKLLPVKIAECRLPLNFRTLHTPEVFRSKEQLGEMADLLSAKLRPNAPAERQIRLSETSTKTFLEDTRSTMLDQSPDFWSQMRREWDWCKRHPVAILLCFAAYFAMLATATTALDLDVQAANGLLTVVFFTAYMLFRRYRLSKAAGQR